MERGTSGHAQADVGMAPWRHGQETVPQLGARARRSLGGGASSGGAQGREVGMALRAVRGNDLALPTYRVRNISSW